MSSEIADVLAAHELDLGALRRDRETEAGYWLACTCGFEWTPVEPFDQHRHHLADLLAARDRRVRGEALREAADLRYLPGEVKGGVGTLKRVTALGYSAWLRDRADRIEGER